MLLILTLYLALVYGIICACSASASFFYLQRLTGNATSDLLFEALPIVFSNQHGLNELQTGLTVGILFHPVHVPTISDIESSSS